MNWIRILFDYTNGHKLNYGDDWNTWKKTTFLQLYLHRKEMDEIGACFMKINQSTTMPNRFNNTKCMKFSVDLNETFVVSLATKVSTISMLKRMVKWWSCWCFILYIYSIPHSEQLRRLYVNSLTQWCYCKFV